MSSVFGTSKITRVPPYGEKSEKLSNCWLIVLMHWMRRKKLQLSAKKRFWKNPERLPKITIFSKIAIFASFSWFFSEMVLCRELRFFALYSAHQNTFLELSKSTIWHFSVFFTLWFPTSQKLTTPLKMAENQKQKYFCGQNDKWIKNPDGTAC